MNLTKTWCRALRSYDTFQQNNDPKHKDKTRQDISVNVPECKAWGIRARQAVKAVIDSNWTNHQYMFYCVPASNLLNKHILDWVTDWGRIPPVCPSSSHQDDSECTLTRGRKWQCCGRLEVDTELCRKLWSLFCFAPILFRDANERICGGWHKPDRLANSSNHNKPAEASTRPKQTPPITKRGF